jgi:hypothetical protein
VILLSSILIGLPAAWFRAKLKRRNLQIPEFNWELLVLVGFLPQFFAFFFHPTQKVIPDNFAAIVLVSSQVILLVFVLANYRLPGFWSLGLGLLLNFVVITANGGLMPISPEVLDQLVPDALISDWEVGTRYGMGKDVILPISKTRCWWLSDRLLLPAWLPYSVAFSIGDIFLAVGAFLLIWAQGGPTKGYFNYQKHGEENVYK